MGRTLTRYRILEAFRARTGELVSGGELAETLGISRAAVWKVVASLQEEGYLIESVANKGYRFAESTVFSGYEIERRLETKKVGRPLIFLSEVNSTNDYVKRLAGEGGTDGTAVVAAAQTGGKGRLGRSFSSPAGQGVYLTLLLRPALHVLDLTLVTLLAAVVAVDTIEELTGVRPDIKWTNDLYLDGKKLCGILTECSVEGEGGRVSYAAVGIGMNLYQSREDFPPEIRDIAGSIEMTTGRHIDAADYVAAFFRHFERYFYEGAFPANKEVILDRYRACLFFLGQEVEVRGLMGSYPAVALDVDAQGQLLVREKSGEMHALNSGEISIRV